MKLNHSSRLIFLIFALGFINPVSGQYIFNNLNKEKGLPSNQVNCIMKDTDGFVWMGTTNGLCRFDGNELTTFFHHPADTNSLCDNEIKSLWQDKKGLIWIGTVRGVSVYNSLENHFTGYFHDPADPVSLSNDKVQFITGDHTGNILIATDGNGLDIFDPLTGGFSHHLPSDQVDIKPARFVNTFMGFVHDPVDSNMVWFGTQAGILKFSVKTKKFIHFLLEKENANEPSLISERENVVRDLLVNPDGKLWLATWGGGLCHFNPADGKYDIYKYEPLNPVTGFRNNIGKLNRKSQDEIWIAATHTGLGVFNTLTHEFSFFTDSLVGQTIGFNPSGIISDEHGFLWVASLTNGLFFTNLIAHQFNKTTFPHPLRGVAACPSNPGLIFSGIPITYGQLVIFDQHTNRFSTHNYSPYNDKSENYFQDLFCGQDKIWLVECYNLYWWDHKQRKVRLYDFDPAGSTVSEAATIPYLISGCETPDGELWIGTTFNGIFRIMPRDGTVKNYYYQDTTAGNIYFKDFVFEVFPDSKGRIWYGSTGFGYFDPGLQKFVNFSLGKDFPEAPVKSVIVRVITETPDGLIWLGTVNSGIQVIDANQPVSFAGSYMQENGLAGSLIRDMITDGNGDVWAVTDKGLSRIIHATRQVENFGPEYGLTHLKHLARIDENELVISADRGMYRFAPDSIRLFDHEIKPYIKTFRIFDRTAGTDGQLKHQQRMDLRPDENFFSIEYGAINFFNPEQTVFSYMLDGLDENWTEAGTRKYVSYTNLPGGNYNFRLRASDGTQGFFEISLPLKIGTPFWKSVWFYFLILFVFSTILFGFFKYRLQHIRTQEQIKSDYDKMIGQLEMKALRAQMNPHFLFNSLNSIRCYVLQEQFDNATSYITKFSKLLRLILHNSRQNMITLAEELEMIRIYIEFEQMRFDHGFEFTEDIDDNVNPANISIQPMTIQPFLENAIWHGLMPKEADRQLRLSLSTNNGLIAITIEDNGIGRKKSESMRPHNEMAESKSYGLQIIRERFEVLAGIRGKRSDFEIIDLVGDLKKPAGTKVIIYYEI